jgi:hypothetical protein
VIAVPAAQEPVISVEAKKTSSLDFKNAGREWHPQGEPEEVNRARLPPAQGKQRSLQRKARRRKIAAAATNQQDSYQSTANSAAPQT